MANYNSSYTGAQIDAAVGAVRSKETTWDGKQDAISDLSTIRSGAAAGATALQTETDPVFSASAAAGITSSNISAWNGKQASITASGLLKGNGSGTITAATASDIPSLPASIISSGTFADARIASASTWNAKLSNPSGGSVGDVLKKTASGVEWGSGGGDSFTKAETLTSSTAAMFDGLSSSSVPNDVFAWLGNVQNKWVWEKSQETITKTDISLNVLIAYGGSINISVSSAVGFVSGNLVLVNPSVVNIAYNDYSSLPSMAPCYIKGLYGEPNTIFYLPSGSTGSLYPSGSTIVVAGSGDRLILNASATSSIRGKTVSGSVSTFGYVLTNTNTAPVESGSTFVGLGQLGAKTQISTGSYAGTGTYGWENPNSLTFNFTPKLLVISPGDNGNNGRQYTGYIVCESSYGKSFSGNDSTAQGYMLYVSMSGNTISFYSQTNADSQLNYSGYTYKYVAIG